MLDSFHSSGDRDGICDIERQNTDVRKGSEVSCFLGRAYSGEDVKVSTLEGEGESGSNAVGGRAGDEDGSERGGSGHLGDSTGQIFGQ